MAKSWLEFIWIWCINFVYLHIYLGDLEFKNVYLSYDENEENYVLKDVNFKVKAGEKIGIVGRTGAGKSSIIAALFR